MRDIFSGRILKNTAWLLGGQLATKFISLLVMVVLGRGLSVQDFGRFNLANAFVAIFGVLVDFGFNVYVTREIAKDRSRAGELLGSIIPFKLAMAAIVMAAIWATSRSMGYERLTELAILGMGVYYVLFSFSSFLRTAFMGNELMNYEAVFSFADRVLTFGAVAALIFYRKGIVAVVMAYPAVEAAILAGCVFALFVRFPGMRLVFSAKMLRKAVTDSVPFFLSGIVMMVYLYIDSVMLSRMKGETAVGLYNASYGLVYNLRLLVTPLITALFPSMSHQADTDRAKLIRVFKSVRAMLVFAGIAVTVPAFALSGKIIALLYGEKMAPSASAFSILILACPFIFVNSFYGFVLVSLDRQKSIFRYLVIVTAANIALNLALIPRYGFLGASAVTVVSEVFFFALCTLDLRRAKAG